MPEVMRWPGKIPAGMVSNEIVSHLDWLPTLLAAAGEPDIKEKLKKGYKAEDKTFKVHLDGYNLLPYLTGKEEKSPRIGFFYFSDDGDLVAPGMTTGKWSLWSSALPVHYRYGLNLLSRCEYRKYSTCVQTLMRGRIRPQTPTMTGYWTTRSCWCHPRVLWQIFWRHSKNFLHARKRQALQLIR
ncbi:alkaline phosphatase family protein [Methanosarcina barkeri]|uniref:Arylsulfatase n=1 Tax=Methanosarcina barkeri 227 TaxID=1434106 RepID=A0A0E3R0Z8_METBA|nr:Arylsulfatase [Methanosarcina barkeri 227]